MWLLALRSQVCGDETCCKSPLSFPLQLGWCLCDQGGLHGNLQQGVLEREKTYSAVSFTTLSSVQWRWLSGRTQ